MATTMSELYSLAVELQQKVAELTGADPHAIFVDVCVHRVDDSQVHIDVVNTFATTEYATEYVKWDGDVDFPAVSVALYSAKGQRFILPPDPPDREGPPDDNV